MSSTRYLSRMTATKGCWTCKDRKVSCDRTVPACIKCLKTKRACGGYGIRLTWPHKDQQERSLPTSAFSGTQRTISRQRTEQWVNVSQTDVLLHILARDAKGGVKSEHVERYRLALPRLTQTMVPVPKMITASDADLIQYFENVMIGILPTLGREKAGIGRLLLRMALSGRSKASKALLLSVVALASRHRGNDAVHAARAKNAAIDALISATSSEMDHDASIEHIATGLTLCLVETNLDCDWIGHLCGARNVLPTVEQKAYHIGSDAAVMLEWLYYFVTFTRFSFRHWRTYMIRATSQELGINGASPHCVMQYRIARTLVAKNMAAISTYVHPVVQLLADVLDTRLYASDPHYHSVEYQQSLDDLKVRLSDVNSVVDKDGEDDDQSRCLELTRLAGLIYLERVSRNFSGDSNRLESWKKDAVSIIASLNTYPPSFAVFIVGCEIHTDEERMVTLDFFTRLEQGPHLNSLLEAKGLVQTAWIQHDLGVEGELEYIHKLNLVLSSRNVIPSFM